MDNDLSIIIDFVFGVIHSYFRIKCECFSVLRYHYLCIPSLIKLSNQFTMACCLAILTAVNDATVNSSESLAFAHHNSLGAQRSYVMRDNKSEYAQFVALGSIKGKELEGDNDNANN